MKRYLAVLVFGLAAIAFMTGCSSNTPSGAVKKHLECMKNKDAKGVVESFYYGDITNDPEELEKGKEQLISMIENEGFKNLDAKGGVKSYEIVKEDAPDHAEPGSIAFVTVKTVYGNGEEVEDKVKVTMDKDGKWKMAWGR